MTTYLVYRMPDMLRWWTIVTGSTGHFRTYEMWLPDAARLSYFVAWCKTFDQGYGRIQHIGAER